MRNRTGDWGIISGLIILGLALRLLLAHFRPPVSGDALVYGDIASNLLHNGRYALTTDGVVSATLIRLPGYPLFLALCFALFGSGNFTAVIALQIALDLLTCCFLGVLAFRLAGRRTGLATLALASLCPFTANYSVVPLTETLSIFCIALGFFAFNNWLTAQDEKKPVPVWLIVMAASAAVAALLRPDRILLFAVLLPAVLCVCAGNRNTTRAGRFAPALTLTAIVAMPLCLWTARNWLVFHVVQPLAPKYANDPGEEVAVGFMRWYRTWGITYEDTVKVYWVYDGSLLDFRDLPPRAFNDAEEKNRTRGLVARYNDESASTPQIDAQFAKLARGRIAKHPVRYYLVLPLARLGEMWLHPRTELLQMPLTWWRWRDHPAKTAFSCFYAALNLAFLTLAIVGFTRWKGHGFSGRPPLAWSMLAFIVLRSALLATLDNAEQRYTIDCFPIIILFAAFAFTAPRLSAEPFSRSH